VEKKKKEGERQGKTGLDHGMGAAKGDGREGGRGDKGSKKGETITTGVTLKRSGGAGGGATTKKKDGSRCSSRRWAGKTTVGGEREKARTDTERKKLTEGAHLSGEEG